LPLNVFKKCSLRKLLIINVVQLPANRPLMNNTAAIWSAVAATFAAFSAFMTMLIHRRNLLDAARPEIVLTDWTREQRTQGETSYEVVSFRKIRNIGRGIALGIYINCAENRGPFPLAVMSTIRIPILPVGEHVDVDGSIMIWWKNVESRDAMKWVSPAITIMSWDSRDIRHETTYKLFVVQDGIVASDILAPGVGLSSRSTVTRAVWTLKAENTLKRMWHALKDRWPRYSSKVNGVSRPGSPTPQRLG
jgi:hypothetical protein